MQTLNLSILLIFYCIHTILGEIPTHRVSSLPGYHNRFNSRHWSGYLSVDVKEQQKIAYTHYWFVENEKQKNDAPTLIWMQGGPGGSSLIGMFTENGPFTLNDESFRSSTDSIPKVYDNPYSWHLVANMLYIEHPAPTGFSYCTEMNSNEKVDCTWNDQLQAKVSYAFIVEFFRNYSEYAENPFYISGESFAGVLVPTLAMEILAHKTDENKNRAPWSLEGFCLGNAVPGSRVYTSTPYSGWLGVQVAVDFRYGHGMISEKTYKNIYKECEGYWGTYEPPNSKICRDLLEDPIRPVMSEAGDTDLIGGGYFIYDTCGADLLYSKLGEHYSLSMDQHSTKTDDELYMKHDKEKAMRSLRVSNNPETIGKEYPVNNAGTYACGQERGAVAWLNLPSVQKAIHVVSTAFNLVTPLEYDKNTFSLLKEYKDVLIPNFRIMQYSGDADPCVPYVGTQRWIDGLGLKEHKPWKPWTVNHQVVGYSKSFEVESAASPDKISTITFATIRDAGHMVPRYKPAQSLHLIRSFLNNDEL